MIKNKINKIFKYKVMNNNSNSNNNNNTKERMKNKY